MKHELFTTTDNVRCYAKLDVRKHLKRGNAKLGKDTIIFNMTSAKKCVSKALGLCQLSNCSKCYALRDEKRFPGVLPYRERQTLIWDHQFAELVQTISDVAAKARNPVNYVRYSEAGDFRTQDDVVKMSTLASMLSDLTIYGYSARQDLNYIGRPKNFVLNGSGWMADNMFKAVSKPSGNNPVCGGDCSVCTLCKVASGNTIEVVMH